MDDTNFNKMMEGKQANWLNLKPGDVDLYDQLNKKEIKEAVKEEATPIPPEINQAIQRFITLKRKQKYTERAIRRMVKRNWGIKIVR